MNVFADLRNIAMCAFAMGLVAACSDTQDGGRPSAAAGASGDAQGGAGGSAVEMGGGAGSGGSSVPSAGAAGVGSAEMDGGSTDAPAGTEAGAADAGAPSLVLPITRGDLDVLEFGSLSFAVNPSKGARIVSFKLDGDELLTDPTANAQYYGSTLWTSPASDWVVPGTFVPMAVVDSQPYTTTVSADNVITATSGTGTANGKKFVITKVFHADLAHNAIVIDYKIANTGTTTFKLSHWEVTRVFPNGLMFFPSGKTIKLDFLPQLVQVQTAQGMTWYDNTTHLMGKGESKAGTDSSGGFIAQVAPNTKGDLLFIKAFPGITAAAAPPGHYPVEFFCNDPHTYVEIEDHSAYNDIAAGATYTQTVTWYLRRLPAGTARTVGSAALIDAVNKTLGKN
jgi:hypothetical protein